MVMLQLHARAPSGASAAAADHHRAHPAAADTTAELRAGQPAALSKVLDQRGVDPDALDRRILGADRVPLAVKPEPQRLIT